MSVKIASVMKNSICEKKGILADSELISINNNKINDVFDYRFYMTQKILKIIIKNKDSYYIYKIKKGEYEDIGLEFDTYLMDQQHSCYNKCIFCFVDQMPKGMRETLYFKDDDARMSFLFGNYITLTNLKQEDIDRIIKMKISPINISVHTTNKELRCKMMKNRFAGEKLDYINQLVDANITINAQIVLCRGINDGKELASTLNDLSKFYPQVQSVACVPAGLTKFREGLFELTPYDEQSSKETIKIIEAFAEKCFKEKKTKFAFASDEFYITAKLPLNPPDYYEEYPQLDNGVGMISLLQEEFAQALKSKKKIAMKRNISVATGVAAFEYIKGLTELACEKFKGLNCNVYAIKNNYFGENITVAGLVTATDIIDQLGNIPNLGTELLIPSVMLRHEQDKFLDDITIEELEQKLNLKIRIVGPDGADLLDALLAKG